MLALLLLLPLTISALLSPILREHFGAIKYVALLASIITLAMLPFVSTGVTNSLLWFSISGYNFHITTQTMPLNMILLWLIAIITPLIIAYSIGFMETPSEQARFYFELCVFASAMLLFAMSGNFIAMFIGWEMLGITSYLLIGFWYYKEKPPQAARKAIITVFIGDMMMLAAMAIIWNAYGTFNFSALASAGVKAPLFYAMLLVMFAAFTKSAQFPFQEWLPDAMEGPTPVSAFLHSSTMVKAGVFIIAVLLPIYEELSMGWLLVAFGIITAIIAMADALVEKHIKRILAYSTIEDMGLMFVALGFGSIVGAMVLFVAQAFYKALLFMNAGTIMNANEGAESIYSSYESRSSKPLFAVMIIGVLSIIGVFPLSGFFGKIGVEGSASNPVVYAILLVIDFVTAIYMVRWVAVPSRKAPSQYESALISSNYRLTPKSMMIPQYILAALVIAASAAFIYAAPSYSPYLKLPLRAIESFIETIVVFIGSIIGIYIISKYAQLSSERHPVLYSIAYSTGFFNSAYRYIASAFAIAGSAFEAFEYSLYDFIKLGGSAVVDFGAYVRKIENGQINTYAMAFAIGILIAIAMMVLL
ncbi:MAG: NADH-quinone oxidoreductase subunit L [Candidatus Micrarchaeia archaeon]